MMQNCRFIIYTVPSPTPFHKPSQNNKGWHHVIAPPLHKQRSVKPHEKLMEQRVLSVSSLNRMPRCPTLNCRVKFRVSHWISRVYQNTIHLINRPTRPLHFHSGKMVRFALTVEFGPWLTGSWQRNWPGNEPSRFRFVERGFPLCSGCWPLSPTS